MKQIPTNATCVYQGETLRVRERPQQLFDGTIKTFEAVERQDTAMVLPVHDNHVLLTYQRQPHKPDRYWDFVGGRVHRDQDPLTGAKRELREETGMQASERKERKQFDRGGGSIKWHWYLYIAQGLETIGTQHLDPGGEEIELKRIDRDTFATMLLDETLRAIKLNHEFLKHKLDGTEDQFLDEIFAA